MIVRFSTASFSTTEGPTTTVVSHRNNKHLLGKNIGSSYFPAMDARTAPCNLRAPTSRYRHSRQRPTTCRLLRSPQQQVLPPLWTILIPAVHSFFFCGYEKDRCRSAMPLVAILVLVLEGKKNDLNAQNQNVSHFQVNGPVLVSLCFFVRVWELIGRPNRNESP